MKHILLCALAAAICTSPSAKASVLDPETVGELFQSATLSFTDAGAVWTFLPEGCTALDSARNEGVSVKALPSYLRGKGVMVLASCRVVDAGAAVSAPVRFLVVQDVSAPESVVLVSVDEDGGWSYACYGRRPAGSGLAAPEFWYWKVDRVERFPQ